MKSLLRSLMVFGVIFAVAACNTNRGKEITKDQEDRLNKLDAKEKELSDKSVKLEGDAAALVKQNEENKEKIKRLEAEKAEAIAKRDELQNQIDNPEVTDEVKRLKEENQNLLNEKFSLQGNLTSQLQARQFEIDNLQNEIDRLNQQISANNSAVAQLPPDFVGPRQPVESTISTIPTIPSERRYSIPPVPPLPPEAPKNLESVLETNTSGKAVPVLVLVKANSDKDKNVIEAKIKQVNAYVDYQYSNAGAPYGSYIVGLKSKSDLEAIKLEAQKLGAGIFAQQIKKVFLRSAIRLHYSVASKKDEEYNISFPESLNDERITADVTPDSKVAFRNLTQTSLGKLPPSCIPATSTGPAMLGQLTSGCLADLKSRLNKTVKVRGRELTMAKAIETELALSAEALKKDNFRSYEQLLETRKLQADPTHSFVTYMTLHHYLLVEGPAKNSTEALAVCSLFNDDVMDSEQQWLHTYLSLPSAVRDIGGKTSLKEIEALQSKLQ